MTMRGRADRDARGKVEVAVAVDVPDVTTGGALRDEGVGLGCGGRDEAVAPFQKGAGSRTGRNGPDVQCRHGLASIYTSLYCSTEVKASFRVPMRNQLSRRKWVVA